MRRSFLIVAIAMLAPCAFAQANFDCYPDGALPLDPAGGCEGLASNGLGGFGSQTGVDSNPSCGFPTTGLKFGRLTCNGPVNGIVPFGPYPWGSPQSSPPAEIRIPIPTGATTISFDWEYFNADGTFFNDGFAVAVLTSTGALVQELAYADNNAASGSCTDFSSSFGTEVAPLGPQSFSGPLPPLSGCEYISVVAWNYLDNAVSGAGYIDNVQFNSFLTGCPVPCFGGSPALSFSSPSGAGCIQVNMQGLHSSGSYFLAVSLVAGSFPNGWFNGIDIAFPDLVAEINLGFPFSGATNNCGGAQVGEFCSAPSGLTLYAVALGINGPVLGSWSLVTQPASYTIP